MRQTREPSPNANSWARLKRQMTQEAPGGRCRYCSLGSVTAGRFPEYLWPYYSSEQKEGCRNPSWSKDFWYLFYYMTQNKRTVINNDSDLGYSRADGWTRSGWAEVGSLRPWKLPRGDEILQSTQCRSSGVSKNQRTAWGIGDGSLALLAQIFWLHEHLPSAFFCSSSSSLCSDTGDKLASNPKCSPSPGLRPSLVTLFVLLPQHTKKS